MGNDVVEITTPHLDRHNDYLQFYVKKTEDGLLFTDGGYVLDDLEVSGVVFNTPKRTALLQQTLNGFGVQVCDGCLTTKADANNFPVRKNNLYKLCWRWAICLACLAVTLPTFSLRMWSIGWMKSVCGILKTST